MKQCMLAALCIFCLFLFVISPLPVGADSSFSDAVHAYQKEDYEKARLIFERLAELGHHGAQFNMGVMNHLGKGVNRDNVQAYAWLSLAAESGEKEWIEIRDKVFNLLTPLQKTQAKELRNSLLYKFGQDALNMSLIPELTQVDLGYCKIKNINRELPVYPTRALRRGEQGWVDVFYTISKHGDVKDIAVLDSVPPGTFVNASLKAVRKFKYGPPLVNGKNSEIYGYSMRVKFAFDTKKTEQYKKRLDRDVADLLQKAETGDPTYQYLYAYVRKMHPDLKISEDEANSWYLKAAQGGYPPAQYDLGRSLMYGLGCEFDNKKSIEWLTLSAKADYPYAQVFLGKWLLSLGDDTKNLKQGLFWLEKAADNDFPSAKMALAWTYATFYDASLRNPARALELAKSSYKDYPDRVTGFETIAAASSAVGNYKNAVKFQKKALKEARKLDWNLISLNKRLDAYVNEKPWIQPADNQKENVL